MLLPLAACVQPSLTTTAMPTTSALGSVKDTLTADAGRLEVTQLKTRITDDGGMLVNGRLRGREFALRFPANWNRQTVLFAHGYALPDGKSDAVASDPVAEDPSFGLLPHAYREGFAVGHSAYDKKGLAVTSAITNTVALKHLADALGSTRAYMTGGSMGGSIAALTSQRNPDEFVGALAVCGVVSDWTYEVGYITELRALYDYFTQATPYALPGSRDVTRSVSGTNPLLFIAPMVRLAQDAEKDPSGRAARIMHLVASAVPGVLVKPELSTLFLGISTQALGMDDMKNEAGGLMVGNRSTIYHSDLLTDAENAALNEGIQRYDADTAAEAMMVRKFSTSGEQRMKLLTMHNAYDPLVPYEHSERLRARVQAAGRLDSLAQRTVPTMNAALPIPHPALIAIGTKAGAAHCGFTSQQTGRAFDDLRAWVENGVRPAESARQNLEH